MNDRGIAEAELRLLHDVTEDAESRCAHRSEARALGRGFAAPPA
jgi:hypothetical protein